MIQLYQFPRCWGMPSMSPYCLKVETYLRMTGTPYEACVGDLRTAPRGQLPYAVIDGEVVGDSGRILARLEARAARRLDEGLGARDRALGHCLTRTLEESTVWTLRHQRFADDRGWVDTHAFVRTLLPPMVRSIAPHMIRRGMRSALWHQGMGRHPPEHIVASAIADFDALSTLLGDRPFVLGDGPHTVDCTAFGFVANFLNPAARSPVTDHVERLPNLVAYCERVRARWFAEFPSWTAVRPADEPARHSARAP